MIQKLRKWERWGNGGLFRQRLSARLTRGGDALANFFRHRHAERVLAPFTVADFGSAFGAREFALAPNFTNFNHGSFGTTPRAVTAAQRRDAALGEARPDDWMRAGLSC